MLTPRLSHLTFLLSTLVVTTTLGVSACSSDSTDPVAGSDSGATSDGSATTDASTDSATTSDAQPDGSDSDAESDAGNDGS